MSKRIWPTRTENVRERQGFRRAQNDDNFEKIDKVPDAPEGNIPVFDDEGGLKDSGKSFNDVVLRDANIAYPTNDYVVNVDDTKILVTCSTVDINITLPADAGSRTYTVQKIDDTEFKVIVSGQAGEVINEETTFELLYQWESVRPTKTNLTLSGSDWIV